MMTQPLTNDDVKKADLSQVFHSWSVQGALNPLAIKSGLGVKVWDFEGNEYLDFSSQLINTNVGHQHPRLIKAIQAQAAELATIAPSHANISRARAAEAILSVAPKGFKKVFFTNGGADAVENAFRMARVFTGKDKILSQYRSYHGNTSGAIQATGERRRFKNEYAHSFVHFFGPHLYRSDFWSTGEEQECERALQHLRRVIESEDPSNIAAIILEGLPGSVGVIVPPQGYFEGVRQLCDEFGIMLIMDEVMSGFGRTGRWFAHQHADVRPDLITIAKGVNSGYVPVGGVIISEAISDYFDDKMFPGGLTYSGHPLAMGSIIENIAIMKDENLVEHADRLGREVLGPGLKALAEKHQIVGDVRGRGLFWAIELVTDRESKSTLSAAAMNELKGALLAKGMLPMLTDNRIHVAPPLVVSEEQLKTALAIYDAVLGEISF
ncbi:aspartate aminotransferase family protein [Oligella urethralis]|uniref:aspartate aminotransferase family protein n=1 Tax=Oligella urethralis TaxID=90245 RepID=UPI001EFA2793|nr:aspartate aminotransferase family protein [Oligella urethralis]